MKDNTAQAKTLLEQAIRSMPSDFSLGEARHLMLAALNSISRVESKRNTRQDAQDKLAKVMDERREAMLGGPYSMTTKEARMAVMTLDKMIAKEKKILEQLGQTGGQVAGQQTRIQTLHS